ncbi:MAG: sterol desaturase family protein [Chitinophagales bacterium]|nr:sterol desaturase family protein [Chitinophagales bacterium]
MHVMPFEYDPVVYAIPFFLITIGIELYVNHKERLQLYETKDSLASIGMGLGSLVIDLAMKTLAFTGYIFLFQFRLFDIGWHWWSWVLVLFADDFTFYWHHRLSHEIRLLWAAHVNHHSSQHFNLSTALRQSWAEQLYKFIWWSWMPLLGFDPLMMMMMMSISLIYQYWVHTELIRKLPRVLELVLNTPSHHRVHHASNIRYLDRNHAGILIIWDRLFGTFAEEREEEKPVYGITKNIHTYNLFKIATHEFADIWHDVKRAPTLKDKLKYMFYSPGWSHNGPDLRANTLRKQVSES